MDTLTKKQRSWNLSMLKSKWTSPEKKIHNILKGRKIKHVMHPKIAGNPDIILPETKTAVFIHGCFWHRCPKHFVMPKTRKKYWLSKIEKNTERDIKNSRKLRKAGWKILRIWEHDAKNLKRISKMFPV